MVDASIDADSQSTLTSIVKKRLSTGNFQGPLADFQPWQPYLIEFYEHLKVCQNKALY
jgi:hypothetical protein